MRKGYDTIALFIPKEFLPINYQLSEYMNNTTNYNDDSGQLIYAKSKIGNLTLFQSEKGLSVRNSLFNFSPSEHDCPYLGDDLRQTIEELNDVLGVNLYKAKITRFDFCFDIVTRYSPNVYFKFFGEKIRYKISDFEDGKYYKTSQRELVFYNKSKQLKIKHKNILRYEIRFAKRIRQQLKLEELTAEDLCDSDFIKQIELIALNEYLSIKKYSNSMLFNLNDKLCSKKIDTLIFQAGVKSIGVERIIEAINISHLAGLCNSTQKHRYKKKLHKINNLSMDKTKKNLIIEIDNKLIELINQS